MKDYIKQIENAERRFFAEPVQFRADNENQIEGYAAVFNKDSVDFGGWIERIAPGAFDDVLNDDAVAAFNHDMSLVFGRNKVNVTLEQDGKGLRYVVSLPDTSLAKDIRTLIKEGIINQSSFAFTVRKQNWEHVEDKSRPSVRTILKVARLFDVSPVTYPAYPDTSVATRDFRKELEDHNENWLEIIDYLTLTTQK